MKISVCCSNRQTGDFEFGEIVDYRRLLMWHIFHDRPRGPFSVAAAVTDQLFDKRLSSSLLYT
jgi:hypothetical protein